MNKVWLLVLEEDGEDVGFFAFSCMEVAELFATSNDLEPYSARLGVLSIDDPKMEPEGSYVWDGMIWRYERL